MAVLGNVAGLFDLYQDIFLLLYSFRGRKLETLSVVNSYIVI